MTNKPMLSVESLLMDIRQSCELSKARDAQIDAALVDLRAIIDKEVGEDSHTPKHPGEPVTFDDWFRREIGDPNEVNCKGVESWDVYVARKALDFRQPALVAPFKPDTVVCRRYTLEGHIFYHYDLEPVYGSVPVTLSDLIFMAEGKPVAVVMPERMKVEPFTTIDRGSKNYKAGYNAAIVEVAKLNGLKT